MSQELTYPAKVANACSNCRRRKVRCTGEVRCKNCVDHGKECIYPPSQRRKATRPLDGDNSMLSQRLMQMEALLQNNTAPGMTALLGPVLNQDGQGHHMTAHRRMSQTASERSLRLYNPSTSSNEVSGILEKASTSSTDNFSESGQSMDVSLPRPILYTRAPLPMGVPTGLSAGMHTSHESVSSKGADRTAIDNEASIVSPENVNWEYHGPGSWLSICSSPGVKWVCERTGVPNFAESAKGLSMGWTKHLKLQRSMNRDRAPEPDLATALQYSRAHFEESHYAVFDAVNRVAFETRLQYQHSQEVSFEDDASWYALRNTVFATGCIILMSKDPSITFTEAQAHAWRYFENALSVHTDLLYTQTGLVAVEALTLMSFYAEGLGSPALEYMLCSSAARLAQSKGLHRQPAKIWNVSEAEILHRNWLFWAIYCCEKAIMNRSGRPSAIDDDDISCEIPSKIPPGSTIDVTIFTCTIKHAQIASQISKKLLSVSAFRQTAAEMLETVQFLDQKLQEWKNQLPPSLQISGSIRPLRLDSSRDAVRIYRLQFAYYGSLMAIHMVMVYPWIAAVFVTDQVPTFRDQASVSAETMAQAARSIILMTRHLNIDVASPAWLAFYYPMVGLINLFVSILRSPGSETAQSDVALMDIAAGHFAHMEFITSSHLAFPFTREVADLARQTVKHARNRSNIEANTNASWNNCVWPNAGVDYWNDLDAMAAVDLDIDSWNTFAAAPVYDTLDGGNGTSYPQGNERSPASS